MRYHVRIAVVEDSARINENNRNALGYDDPPEKTRVQLEKVLKRATDRVYVVCDENDAVVGFLHAADYETIHSGSFKNIVSLAVDEPCRGLGLGKLLLNAAENWAAQDHCEGVRLVSGFNRVQAHAFYEHCGYHLRKEQKNLVKYL